MCTPAVVYSLKNYLIDFLSISCRIRCSTIKTANSLGLCPGIPKVSWKWHFFSQFEKLVLDEPQSASWSGLQLFGSWIWQQLVNSRLSISNLWSIILKLYSRLFSFKVAHLNVNVNSSSYPLNAHSNSDSLCIWKGNLFFHDTCVHASRVGLQEACSHGLHSGMVYHTPEG